MSLGSKCKVCLDCVVDNRCGCGGGLIAPTPFANPQPLGDDVEGNPMPKADGQPERCACDITGVYGDCHFHLAELVHGQTPAETWRYGTLLGYAGLVAALVAAFAAGWCAK